jgi:hypothetical protein
MRKQFKIGEYAIGGIIAIETKGDIIKVDALDWVSKQPVLSDVFHTERSGYLRQIEDFLFQLTTSYYTDKIMEFIKTKVCKQ